jgi:alginate O-acetyltransferase complex protein AlgI
MIFSSVQYLIFLPIVVFLYWRLNGLPRLILTVVASYVFYMSWLPIYGVLLALMTAINWALSIGIENCRTPEPAVAEKTATDSTNSTDSTAETSKPKSKAKLVAKYDHPRVAKAMLLTGLVLNVGSLCYYKYANFVFENISGLIHSAAPFVPLYRDQFSAVHIPLVDALLPLGISFFVFEFVHYLCDVYKGDKAVRSFFEFAAFAVFFPSQIAGPIKRYQDFIPKLRNPLPLTNPLMVEGTSLFMQGLFKKAAIADPIGAIIARPYSSIEVLSAPDAWIAGIGFVIQVYCDFSGYTDMGRGSALLLGIRLPLNFNLPLLSPDISAFWRRWHMSLGGWLKDYVYIPLGGSHCSMSAQNRNLFITMVVCGLWHGASWHYIIFGAMQGAGLIVHRQWCVVLEKLPALKKALDNKVGAALGTLMTFAFIAFTYMLFRAPDMPHTITIWSSLLNVTNIQATLLEPVLKSGILVIATGYFIFWQATEYIRRHETLLDAFIKTPDKLSFTKPVRLATYTAAAILMVASKPLEAVPFVYFQF